MNPTLEILTGTVKRIQGEMGDFCVADLELECEIPAARNRFTPNYIKIKGKLKQLAVGVVIGAVGYWDITGPRNGGYLQVIFWWNEKPSGKDKFKAYLCSDLFRGCGPGLAAHIWDRFKDDTVLVFENEPRRLQIVPGIGPKRAAEMGAEYKNSQVRRELYYYLIHYGVPPIKIAKIYEMYEQPLEAIKGDPYKIGREVGLDFKICDAIAADMGLPMRERQDYEPEIGMASKIGNNIEPEAGADEGFTAAETGKPNNKIDEDKLQHDNEHRQREAHKSMEQYLTKYKVFIDTCSLLYEKADLFWEHAIPFLQQTGNRIIIPRKVVEEILNHWNNPEKPELAEKAREVYQKLYDLHEKQLIDIRGEKTDNFADNVFQMVFTKFRLNYKLLLITQDNNLAQDILALNNSKSQRGYTVAVKRINKYGYLSNMAFSSNNKSLQTVLPVQNGWNEL